MWELSETQLMCVSASLMQRNSKKYTWKNVTNYAHIFHFTQKFAFLWFFDLLVYLSGLPKFLISPQKRLNLAKRCAMNNANTIQIYSRREINVWLWDIPLFCSQLYLLLWTSGHTFIYMAFKILKKNCTTDFTYMQMVKYE